MKAISLVFYMIIGLGYPLREGRARFTQEVGEVSLLDYDTIKESYPFLASLVMENELCGGAVIADRYLATARHCLEKCPCFRSDGNDDWTECEDFCFVKLRINWNNTRGPGNERKIKRIHLPKNSGSPYRSLSRSPFLEKTDLALLELEESVNTCKMRDGNCWHISPVRLYDTSDPRPRKLRTIGWRPTRGKEELPGQLDVKVKDTTKFRYLLETSNEQDTDSDSCFGISGGPVLIREEDGMWTLVATTLLEGGNECRGSSRLWNKISVHVPWIRSIIEEGQDSSSPNRSPSNPKTPEQGVLITGGAGAETSIELFLPHTGKTCSLQSLPDKRYFHSLDVLGGENKKIILCGGYYTRKSCLQFLPNSSTGSWVNYATLAEGRYAHTSHVFKDALALYGGATSPQTSEQIGSRHQFNLEEETTAACSIPDGPSAILTGGWNSDSGYLKTVARYAISGRFVENLPDLAQGRQGHVCGHFINKSKLTIMVIAGGEGSDGYLSSTELLLSGATSWISGESLPRTLYTAASVNMDYRSNYFLIIGGYSGTSRGEVLMFNGTWTEVGMMKIGRSAAAATMIVTGITEC